MLDHFPRRLQEEFDLTYDQVLNRIYVIDYFFHSLVGFLFGP